MSPNFGTNLPIRRRQTLLSKVSPKTAGGDQAFSQQSGRPHTGIWVPHQDGSYREAVSPFAHEPALDLTGVDTAVDLEEFPTFPKPATRQRQSKSFSSIRHGVSELRTIARGMSLSRHHKPSKHTADEPQEKGFSGLSPDESRDNRSGHSWFRSHRLPHRSSLSGLSALNRHHLPVDNASVPVTGNRNIPPPLPTTLAPGAAARAAAAAQNELIKIERTSSNKELPPPENESKSPYGNLGIKPSFDSESGIEINIQDRVDVVRDSHDFVRKDPATYLSTELMAQILSFLDAESLKNTELVCSSWNIQACSPHVWRKVFYHEYRQPQSVSKNTSGLTKPMGLGRKAPNQDWKKIYGVRRILENRWKEGKAAAIYLNGHEDSVYCVQFDENKIITGSRDRTIRIWDAHYPWSCLKVIGASPPPTENTSVGPLTINPSSESSGRSPFISICPPAHSSAELASRHSYSENHHNASILCLQFDDTIMVTGSSDFTCIVWDIKNDYTPIRRLEGHRSGVLDICFDDKYIVSCSKDTTICVWDRETGELVKKLLGHRGPVNAVQLRGDLVVSASGDGVAKLWNIKSGLCIKEFASKDRGLACVEFSEDARTILAGGNDQVIYQFDANTGELVNEMDGHSGLVRSLHIDNTNGRIVSGSYDMSVKVFDAKSGELAIDLPDWTTSWMLSAKSDYRRIVATSQDARAVIMDFGYGLDGIDLLEG